MHKPRKLALAVLASITIAGIAGASASSLGGLNSSSIGSDDAITAACDTIGGIDVTYNTVYNATAGRFDVGSVTFSSVDAACAGLDATMVLADGTGAALASASGTAASTSFTLTPASAVSAEAIESISLVIQG